MIQQIRNNKFSKVIAMSLAVTLFFEVVAPVKAYALTEGPSQPEFNSFTPLETSDMVNLTTGDFNYNIPIMDIGGYPINLAYDSGITMDQEASWVGLGWNLNVGQINRDVRGIPDDFNGDEIQYENNLKKNKTVGMVFNINPQFAGLEALGLGLNAGLTVEYNNYEGIGFKPSYGFSFELANNVQVGMNLTTSATEGVSASPNLSFSARKGGSADRFDNAFSSKNSIGLGYNSRQGLTSFNLSSSNQVSTKNGAKTRGYHNSMSGSGDVSFVTNTFTPSKRVGFNNTNYMFSFSAGTDFWSIDLEGGVSAYGSFSEIRDKNVMEKAYGYENTHKATENDILDFNRENDRPVSKNSLVLPVVNYTYDMYSIQGQGAGGSFRPERGQVGYVFDQHVSDSGASESLGGEVEGATGFHVGFDYKHSPSSSHTGVWNTIATNYFKEQTTNNALDYETTYFKSNGEISNDKESLLFHNKLGGYDPIALKISGATLGKYAANKFKKQSYNVNGTPFINDTEINFTDRIKKSGRVLRNQMVQKITKSEAQRYGYSEAFVKQNSFAKSHHTAGIKVTDGNGSVSFFGETAYNTLKREATFAARGTGDCQTGKISYGGNDNSISNSAGVDNYFNRVTTPAFAHTYLLTSTLSADYEDLTGNGPSDDDLGMYTKFKYIQKDSDYNWRVPYSQASYNAGLNSHPGDQKGSYVYGKKELKYIQTIETKSHVAYFKLSARNDGLGVTGENGGKNTGDVTYRLDKVYLFSKPQYEQFRTRLENTNTSDDPTHDELAKFSMKIAHFEYDYSLCKKIENSTTNEGKLTLKKVYFTFRDSNMGKYTPYVFNYDSFNPDYHIKSYDFWGNYMPVAGDLIKRSGGVVQYSTSAKSNNPIPLLNATSSMNCGINSAVSAQEFPFVQQEDKKLQDAYASAWSLTSVELPSGGRIELDYESDDYGYVQDRKAMKMYTVVGAGKDAQPLNTTQLNSNLLYNIGGSSEAKFLYVKLQETALINEQQLKERYIGDNMDVPVYFNFLMNMSKQGGLSQNITGNEYDYVSGYFKLDKTQTFKVFSLNGGIYAALPMEFSDMEGGVNGQKSINPISKAGWYFGRANLNRLVYGLDMHPGEDIESIARALQSSIGAVSEIFQGPNGRLRNQFSIARTFVPQKSWIRLQHPGDKLGGGVRVKKLVMYDNWDKMLNVTDVSLKDRYANTYGQEYTYKLQDGSSSGVASYEPIGNKENPFVEPFYDRGERLVAPREMNYVEKPFGESFFPSPSITYSRVEVNNLVPDNRVVDNKTYEIKKHAKGKSLHEFYTTRDFPTKVTMTQLDKPENYYSNEGDFVGEFMKSLVGAKIETNSELTLSQGFVVQTNDMNGKPKSESVYNTSNALINKTEYNYATNAQDPSQLENRVTVLKEDGTLEKDNNEIGVHYDVVTDFRESYSNSQTFGVQGNVAGFVIGIFPIIIPMGVPDRAEHTSVLHTTTTTKVIQRSGILKEKIVTNLGSRVSAKNLAWDGNTGEVLLTKTINEYDDSIYSLNFPAYWKYKDMGFASKNADIKGRFMPFVISGKVYFRIFGQPANTNLSKYLNLGDEVLVNVNNIEKKAWVAEYSPDKTAVKLITRQGAAINGTVDGIFRIERSGYRNQLSEMMASITLMTNPLDDNVINNDDFIVTPELSNAGKDRKILNATAKEYKNLWGIQCENKLPTYEVQTNADGTLLYNTLLYFNPYVYNLLGDWRPNKAYTYMTARKAKTEDSSPRMEGYFKSFSPFYVTDGKGGWNINQNGWVYVDEITQFSPYGAEIESLDVVGAYSSAQFGYNYKMPVAISKNARYSQMGFDGFEDYSVFSNLKPHFAFSESLNQNVAVSANTSHTGKKSVAVSPGAKATFVRKIDGCKPRVKN